jgi:hypothetical protein
MADRTKTGTSLTIASYMISQKSQEKSRLFVKKKPPFKA